MLTLDALFFYTPNVIKNLSIFVIGDVMNVSKRALLLISLLMITSVAFTGTAVDNKSRATAQRKRMGRRAEGSERKVYAKEVKERPAISAEEAEHRQPILDRLQKENEQMIAQLNQIRSTKEFRDGKPSALDEAAKLESRITAHTQQIMEVAARG